MTIEGKHTIRLHSIDADDVGVGIGARKGIYANDFPKWEDEASVTTTEETADAIIGSVKELMPGYGLGKRRRDDGLVDLYVQIQVFG